MHGQTEIVILIVGLATCNPPKNQFLCHQDVMAGHSLFDQIHGERF